MHSSYKRIADMHAPQRPFREAVPSILLVMTVVVFTSMSRAVLSPLLYLVEQEFQLTHGPSSRLFLYISIGFSLSLLLSGHISSRITHRRTILLACLILSGGMAAAALSANALMLSFALVFVGTGAGLYPSSGISVLHSLVVRRDLQKAISLHELGPHIGMLSAPLIANIAVHFGSWRSVYVTVSAASLAAGLLVYAKSPRDSRGGEAPSLQKAAALFKNFSFLILMLHFSLALGSMQGIYALVPVFLIEEVGIRPEQANFLFSISRMTPLIALVVTGPLQDRFGPKKSLGAALAASGLLMCLMGLLEGSLLTVAVLVQPAFSALILPAAVGASIDIGPDESRNVTFSMLLPIAALIGTGVIPSLIGYMGDQATFSLAFLLLGIFTAASSLLTGLISHQEQGTG